MSASPKNQGGTHWEDCWKSHPECAYEKGRRDGLEAAAKALEMDEQGIQELARDGTAADAIRALKSD